MYTQQPVSPKCLAGSGTDQLIVSIPRRDPAVIALRSPHPIFPMIRIIKQDPDFIAIYTFARLFFVFIKLATNRRHPSCPSPPHSNISSCLRWLRKASFPSKVLLLWQIPFALRNWLKKNWRAKEHSESLMQVDSTARH